MEIRNFEHLLCVGKSLLNNNCNHIKKLFFDKERCLYEYTCENKTDKVIEIILNGAVLVCIFEDENCKKTILYFSKLDDIIDCIRYCDENFNHDKEERTWELLNSYLTLYFPDDNSGRFGFVQTLMTHENNLVHESNERN